MDFRYLCRICLTTSDTNMNKLLECDVFCKLRTFLIIEIPADDSLPNRLCDECITKISEINKFCLSVQENEEKLKKYLKSGSLQNYYLNLTNNVHIKEEQNESIIFCDSQSVKIEDCNTEKAAEIVKNTSEGKLSRDQNNKDINFDDNDFKNVELADGNSIHSSDDEILSTIKKEKVLNASPTQIQNKRTRKINSSKKSPIIVQHQTIDTNMESIEQFTCLTCLKPFDSRSFLNTHYHNEHLNKYKHTDRKYTEHEIDGQIMYTCDICENNCNTKKDILKHVLNHNDERPLFCKLCGRTYKTVMEIIRHTRVHNGIKLQCAYKCGYSTAYQGALKEHENRHQDVHKYTCEKCGKGFNVKTWYEQHQNIHSGLKPFVCSICGLAFHMARYLTAHRSSVHPNSSSVRRYICVHCGLKCDSANSLAIHLEEHGINKDKEFLCELCGKIVSSADRLKCHRKMHSGVKPYSCSICNKSFTKKYNVKVHMTSHSGEKIHSCARCGKRYAQRCSLLQHLKRHHASKSPLLTA